MRRIQREIVSALIWSSDNKLLQGRKDPAKGGVYATAWHIPGGGVDEGETNESALAREVLEETGIHIQAYPVARIDYDDSGTSEKTLKDTGEVVLCDMHFNVYEVRIPAPAAAITITPSDDLVELKWFSIDELKDIELTPPSRKYFSEKGYL